MRRLMNQGRPSVPDPMNGHLHPVLAAPEGHQGLGNSKFRADDHLDPLDPNELVFWKISDESLDDGIGFVRFFPEFDDLLSGDA